MYQRLTAIVMASGFSRRMGQNKLLMPYKGKPLIMYAFEVLSQFEWQQVIVVTVYNEVAAMAEQYGWTVVYNDAPERGQSYSIVLGVKESKPDTEGWVFFNGDMPYLQADTVQKLIDSFQMTMDRLIVPWYGEKPGVPTVFPKRFRDELIHLEGDQGGRQILRAHPDQILYIPIDDAGQSIDIDTVENFQKLEDGFYEK